MAGKFRRGAAILTAGVMSLAMAFSSMADWQSATSEGGTYEGPYDAGKNGSLAITLYDRTTVKEGEEPAPVTSGGKISLVKLADFEKQYTEIVMLPDVQGAAPEINVDWNNLQDAETLEKWQEAILEKESDLSSLIRTKDIDGEGSAKFDDLAQGVYMVFQKENDNAPGYQYVAPYLIGIPTGNLIFEGKVEIKDGKSEAFVYNLLSQPKISPFTGEDVIDPPVKKIITDKEGKAVTREDRFSFLLEPQGDAPMPEGNDINKRLNGDPNDKTTTVEESGGSLILSMDGGLGPQEFGIIHYDEPGTYKYKVYEKAGEDADFTYDDKVYDLTVTVSLQRDGTLKAETNYDELMFEFTNIFSPPGPPTPEKAGQDDPGVVKAVKDSDGQTLNVKDRFSFRLTPVGDAPLPDEKHYGVSKTGKQNLASTTVTKDGDSLVLTMDADAGTQKFGVAEYKEAGTYKYQISEVLPNQEGVDDDYKYDTKVREYTVTVTEKDGKLSAKSSADAAMKFTNTFRGTTTDIVKVKKVVREANSNNEVNDTRKFTFELRVDEDKNKTAPMPAGGETDTLKTVKASAADGTVSFGKIAYDKAGTYYYTVTEKKENNNNYTFDTKTYYVTVKVADKNGLLDVTNIIVATEPDGEPISESAAVKALTFTNKKKSGGGGHHGGGGGGGGGSRIVSLNDPDVPLAVLEDEAVPLAAPQTGDNSRMVLFGGIALAAVALLVIWFAAARRKER